MVAWMIDAFGRPDAARALAARSDDDGAPGQLLPDRARRRLRCREPRHPRRAPGRAATSSTAARPSSRAPAQSDLYACMVRTGGPGAAGISCLLVERDSAGPELRQAGEEARLALAADRDGGLRGLRGAGGPADRRRGRGLQDRDGRAWTAAASTSPPARSAPPAPATSGRARICSSAASSAGAWPSSRRCSSSSPTWRPSWPPPG